MFVQSSGILRVQDRVPTQEREWGVSRGGVLLLPPKHAQASTHLAHTQKKPNWYLLALTCSLINEVLPRGNGGYVSTHRVQTFPSALQEPRTGLGKESSSDQKGRSHQSPRSMRAFVLPTAAILPATERTDRWRVTVHAKKGKKLQPSAL